MKYPIRCNHCKCIREVSYATFSYAKKVGSIIREAPCRKCSIELKKIPKHYSNSHLSKDELERIDKRYSMTDREWAWFLQEELNEKAIMSKV